MRVRATVRLVTALALVATGLLVGVLTGRPEAAIAVVPWAALLVLGLTAPTPTVPSLRLRADRDRAVVGGPVELAVDVAGVDGTIEVTWVPAPPFRGDAAPPARVDVADRRGRARLTCELAAAGWGSHDLGRVGIRVHHPHRLLESSGLAVEPVPVRVHPHPTDLRRLLTPMFVRRLTGAHRSRAVGRGVEYADIRAYGSGDSVRDINWRASARSDRLLVSQRHPERSSNLVLLLDSFVESGHDVWSVLGQAIEISMALAESHLSVSDQLGLVEVGGVVRWVAPGSGRHHLERLVDALLATRLYESAAERRDLPIPPRALPPRSLVVALSPLLDHRFLTALGTIRSRGHDVAVIELPPPLGDEGGRAEGRRRSTEAGRRMWRLERAATVDRLAGRGIVVVAHHPDRPLDATLDELTRARARVGAPRRA